MLLPLLFGELRLVDGPDWPPSCLIPWPLVITLAANVSSIYCICRPVSEWGRKSIGRLSASLTGPASPRQQVLCVSAGYSPAICCDVMAKSGYDTAGYSPPVCCDVVAKSGYDTQSRCGLVCCIRCSRPPAGKEVAGPCTPGKVLTL
jgi:hypothetical protein